MGDDLPGLLQLSQEQIDRLVSTGQLRPIRICGEVRFDSNELDALIETYKQIGKRKIDATFKS
jgi:predicted DNA-binding transcriptional regulator AlpA